MGTPAVLPANFNGFDDEPSQSSATGAPQTLPANFSGFDENKQQQGPVNPYAGGSSSLFQKPAASPFQSRMGSSPLPPQDGGVAPLSLGPTPIPQDAANTELRRETQGRTNLRLAPKTAAPQTIAQQATQITTPKQIQPVPAAPLQVSAPSAPPQAPMQKATLLEGLGINDSPAEVQAQQNNDISAQVKGMPDADAQILRQTVAASIKFDPTQDPGVVALSLRMDYDKGGVANLKGQLNAFGGLNALKTVSNTDIIPHTGGFTSPSSLLMASTLTPAAIENPVRIIGGYIAGVLAGKGVQEAAAAVGATPEQQEQANVLGFFLPSIVGHVMSLSAGMGQTTARVPDPVTGEIREIPVKTAAVGGRGFGVGVGKGEDGSYYAAGRVGPFSARARWGGTPEDAAPAPNAAPVRR